LFSQEEGTEHMSEHTGHTDRVDDELRELGQTWAEAERGGDIATLDGLLADDFVGVGPLGFMLGREQWLGRYKSGDLVNKRFDWEPVRVRSYGTTAVVIGVQTQDTTYKDKPTGGGRFRVTQVLISSEGRWRLVSVHIGNLADGAA
jgi:ketosteroid isomerase-like protein